MIVNKEILELKSGRKYWLITIQCPDCSNNFTYKKQYSKKLGRTKVYCDECKKQRDLEKHRKHNEKRAKKQTEYYLNKVKPHEKTKYLTKLGGKKIDTDDIKNHNGVISPDSVFKATNEAYTQNNNATEWRFNQRNKCKYCGGKLYWDDIERGFLCSKCFTVFREDENY